MIHHIRWMFLCWYSYCCRSFATIWIPTKCLWKCYIFTSRKERAGSFSYNQMVGETGDTFGILSIGESILKLMWQSYNEFFTLNTSIYVMSTRFKISSSTIYVLTEHNSDLGRIKYTWTYLRSIIHSDRVWIFGFRNYFFIICRYTLPGNHWYSMKTAQYIIESIIVILPWVCKLPRLY